MAPFRSLLVRKKNQDAFPFSYHGPFSRTMVVSPQSSDGRCGVSSPLPLFLELLDGCQDRRDVHGVEDVRRRRRGGRRGRRPFPLVSADNSPPDFP